MYVLYHQSLFLSSSFRVYLLIIYIIHSHPIYYAKNAHQKERQNQKEKHIKHTQETKQIKAITIKCLTTFHNVIKSTVTKKTRDIIC